MLRMSRKKNAALALSLPLALSCSLAWVGPAAAQDATSLRKATRTTAALALASRQNAVDLGFEAFRKKVFKEPFAGGVYIVNGDTPILDEAELREFYMKEIVQEWKSTRFGLPAGAGPTIQLIVDAPGGKPNVWDNVAKKALSYCVSKGFGGDYERVKASMAAAAQAWQEVSDVRFVHRPELDAKCSATTPEVVFDVRPVNVNGQYLARAFFPRTPRPQRNVLIDASALKLEPGKLTLDGILRHELGHTLSYRHEHTRAESGKCFEDKDWVPLTSYDAFSVMHYPQCNGLGDWSLTLTSLYKTGAACLYGPAAGFTLDPAQCPKL